MNMLGKYVLQFWHPATNVSTSGIVLLLRAQLVSQVPVLWIHLTTASPCTTATIPDLCHHGPVTIVHCKIIVKENLLVMKSSNAPVHPEIMNQEMCCSFASFVGKPACLLKFPLTGINIWHTCFTLLPCICNLWILTPWTRHACWALKPCNLAVILHCIQTMELTPEQSMRNARKIWSLSGTMEDLTC